MQRLTSPRQRGLSLLEALVALVVSALGILGVAGMQLRTLSDTQNAVYRSQAVRLIEELSERLKVHPNALLQINPKSGGSPSYVVDKWNASLATPSKNCKDNWCDANELAVWDIEQWQKLVRSTLPAGDGAVFLAQAEDAVNGDRRQLGVLLRWRQNERTELSEQDKKNTNVTLIKTDSGFQSGIGLTELDKGCTSSNYTCHLQYITVSARCTPTKTADGTLAHSCPV